MKVANLNKILIMNRIIYLFIIIGLFSCNEEASSTNKTAKTDQVKPKPTNTRKIQKPADFNSSNKPYSAKNEGWLVNLDEAFEESKKTGKPVLANFTGSDWCGWCKKLDRSVFHQPGFDKWAEENVVLLELDFPRRFRLPPDVAQQNNALKQKFGVRGFPTIWVFDVDKNDSGQWDIEALGKTGYTKTLGEFQSTVGRYIAQK